jgi:hypothetical protein
MIDDEESELGDLPDLDWGGNDIDVSSVNLAKEMKEAATLKVEMDDLAVKHAAVKERLKEVLKVLRKTLEALNIDKLNGEGWMFYKRKHLTATKPVTLQEKKELFQFLQKEGIFLEMASVDSKTLNKLIKIYSERAEKEGNFDFTLPGVRKPVEYFSLEMRRGK